MKWSALVEPVHTVALLVLTKKNPQASNIPKHGIVVINHYNLWKTSVVKSS